MLEELSLTEGGQTAKKILRQNMYVRIAIILETIALLICAVWALRQGYDALYLSTLFIMISCAFAARIYFLRVHKILSVECDPYKAEEAYTYLYKKKENKLNAKAKQKYYLLIAQSILFEDVFDRSLALLAKVDPDQLKFPWKLYYYDCFRMYYGRKKLGGEDVAKELGSIRSYFELILRQKGSSRRNKKAAQNQLDCMALSDSLDQRDLSVYQKLREQKNWHKGLGMVVVSQYWADARAYEISGDLEALKKACYYVIANGNRLYYVGLAKGLLEKIDQNENRKKGN